MDEGIHPHFTKKRQSWISQELPRYNVYIHISQDIQCSTRSCIEPKIENIVRKNQNGFLKYGSTSQILTIRRILEGVYAKNQEATLFFVFFTKAFDSIHRGKMEQTRLAYGLPKETIPVIMMLYRNTKVNVRSSEGNTDYFDIVVGVLQGGTLAPCLVIICLDYVLRTSIDQIKENCFKRTKERSSRYSTQTITDADYTDDIALMANATAQQKPCYIVWNE